MLGAPLGVFAGAGGGGDGEGGFCLVGKSACIKEKKGCICADCPVTAKMGLKWGYYCTDGSAKSMMEAEMKG